MNGTANGNGTGTIHGAGDQSRPPVISVRDVTKVYQMGDVEVFALNGVDLDIWPGEMTAIMGPSGSGKSTLMNVIGCLDVPTGGTYMLDGVDVHKLKDDDLAAIRCRKIGFVFQNFNLLPRTTALANVELPLIYSGTGGRVRRHRAEDALKRVGLGERMHHRPNELSGGQQQRVAIARALVNEPAMILADEPTGNLDTRTSVEIMELFQRLNSEQGITIVFVTHNIETADYCNRVVHVRDGVVERDVRHQPRAGIYRDLVPENLAAVVEATHGQAALPSPPEPAPAAPAALAAPPGNHETPAPEPGSPPPAAPARRTFLPFGARRAARKEDEA
jgi:putative ABC transport system ATP-binding protein